MKKILIIDDEKDVEFVFKTIFEDFIADEKLQIDFFNNPKQCLEYFRNNPNLKYDFIFSDINMPQIDGVQLVSELRKLGYKGPVSFISAYMEEDYRHDMKRLNVFNFLGKPLDFELIKDALQL